MYPKKQINSIRDKFHEESRPTQLLRPKEPIPKLKRNEIGVKSSLQGLEIKRLYRYADKTVDINKMPTELVLDLACYFHIEVNKFYNDMVEYLSK
jgi:hypothetical protein